MISDRKSQRGVAVIVFVVIVAMMTFTTIYTKYTDQTIARMRESKTSVALQKAKEALIYYSLRNEYLNSVCVSNTNCARPGDLPCPDETNDGIAETSCGSVTGSNQSTRLNRLPWRTLDLGDLTDGNGERLWYAVSNNYKNNTRTLPLNSNTVGTITVRDSAGRVVYDATTGGGVVAVILSAGNTILRQDGIVQNRSGLGLNVASNYLDNANGEDNDVFVDGGLNGFIFGPVKNGNGDLILNDRLIIITRDEMAAAMETYVLTQVRKELLEYYSSFAYYPYPALFNDVSCISTVNADITVGCNSLATNHEGRIPVSNVDQAGTSWPNPTSQTSSTSILMGSRLGNWFQQNLWRELIYYAIAPDCDISNTGCTGTTQKLTLNNATTMPTNNKNVIVISAGRAIGVQNRGVTTQLQNYYEADNLSQSDFIYNRAIATNNLLNDRAMSIP